MQNTAVSVWDTDAARQFAEVVVAMDDVGVLQNFLRDVMTKNEIIEIGARLQAAKMLQAGKTYTEIVAKTKLSSRTVARISDWMRNGCGGYEAALRIIATHHGHTPPARAE